MKAWNLPVSFSRGSCMDKISLLKPYLHGSCYFLITDISWRRLPLSQQRERIFHFLGVVMWIARTEDSGYGDINYAQLQPDSPSLALNNPTKRAPCQWLGNCSCPHAHVTRELCFDVRAKWLRMQEQIV